MLCSGKRFVPAPRSSRIRSSSPIRLSTARATRAPPHARTALHRTRDPRSTAPALHRTRAPPHPPSTAPALHCTRSPHPCSTAGIEPLPLTRGLSGHMASHTRVFAVCCSRSPLGRCRFLCTGGAEPRCKQGGRPRDARARTAGAWRLLA
eukprot:5142046-Prymnesium_polylepis.1